MPKDEKGHGSNPWSDKTWFHGSPSAKIDKFNPDLTKRGVYGRGIYVTRRRDLAQSYAGQGGTVHPVEIKTARTLDLNTSEGRHTFKTTPEEHLRKKYDVIRAPGQSVVLNASAIRHKK